MLQVRRDREIHKEDGGWFVARWHFSFDRYRDPRQMGVGPLRVFNHDQLAPGAIWPMHPHADVHISRLSPGTVVTHDFGVDRGGYLYLIEGRATIGTEELATGDAVKIEGEAQLRIEAKDASELILVDVPLRFTPVGVWAR